MRRGPELPRLHTEAGVIIALMLFLVFAISMMVVRFLAEEDAAL